MKLFRRDISFIKPFKPAFLQMIQKINFSLHHVSLIVSDTKKSIAFFSGILGLQQTDRPNLPYPGAWFQLGDQQVHLLELENPDPVMGRPKHGGRDRHIALSVEFIEPVKALLDKAGVAYTLSKSGRKALFCRDPDGNAVEILERVLI